MSLLKILGRFFFSWRTLTDFGLGMEKNSNVKCLLTNGRRKQVTWKPTRAISLGEQKMFKSWEHCSLIGTVTQVYNFRFRYTQLSTSKSWLRCSIPFMVLAFLHYVVVSAFSFCKNAFFLLVCSLLGKKCVQLDIYISTE